MKAVRIPGPDIPALIVIGLLLQVTPVAAELFIKWTNSGLAPIRIVFLGW